MFPCDWTAAVGQFLPLATGSFRASHAATIRGRNIGSTVCKPSAGRLTGRQIERRSSTNVAARHRARCVASCNSTPRVRRGFRTSPSRPCGCGDSTKCAIAGWRGTQTGDRQHRRRHQRCFAVEGAMNTRKRIEKLPRRLASRLHRCGLARPTGPYQILVPHRCLPGPRCAPSRRDGTIRCRGPVQAGRCFRVGGHDGPGLSGRGPGAPAPLAMRPHRRPTGGAQCAVSSRSGRWSGR